MYRTRSRFERRLATLHEAAQRENTRFALRTLRARWPLAGLHDDGPGAATLIECLAVLATCLPADVPWRESQAEVATQFSYRRGASIVPTHFAVGEALPLPDGTRVSARSVAKGFPRRLVRGVEHTLDAQNYIRNSIGDFLLRDACDRELVIELHAGTLESTLGSLRARGIREFARVNAPLRYTGVETLAAPGRLIFTEIHGPERLHHMLLMLGVAEVDGMQLCPSQIEVHHFDESPAEQRYRALLGQLPMADCAVLGFKNTLLDALRPEVTLHAADSLGDVAWACCAGKRLLLVRTPYGSLAGDCTRALVSRGVRQVLLLGVAGGLRADARVGDVVAPTTYFDADDRPVLGMRNDMAHVGVVRLRQVLSPLDETVDYIEALRNVCLWSAHKGLMCADYEHKSESHIARRWGYDLLDMEATSTAAALSAFPHVQFGSLHVISDLPGTAHSLDVYHSETASHGVRRAVRLLLSHLELAAPGIVEQAA
jgi:purine nucleoside phosphorylase